MAGLEGELAEAHRNLKMAGEAGLLQLEEQRLLSLQNDRLQHENKQLTAQLSEKQQKRRGEKQQHEINQLDLEETLASELDQHKQNQELHSKQQRELNQNVTSLREDNDNLREVAEQQRKEINQLREQVSTAKLAEAETGGRLKASIQEVQVCVGTVHCMLSSAGGTALGPAV